MNTARKVHGPWPAVGVVWAGSLLALASLGALEFGYGRSAAFGPGWVPTAPITAVLFLLLGSACLLRLHAPDWRGGRWFAGLAGAIVTTVSVLVFARPWLARPLPWDGWLVDDALLDGLLPLGVMSPFTAGLMLLFTFAFCLRLSPWFPRQAVQRLAGLAAAAGVVAATIVALGYAAGAPLYYDRETVPMALLTSVVFVLFNFGLLLSGPGWERLRREWWLEGELRLPPGDRSLRRRFGGAALLLMIAMALAGFYFVRAQQADAQETMDDQLTAVAELKAAQVGQWREERLGEAKFLSRTPAVAEDIARLLGRRDDPVARRRVLGWLEPIKGGRRYASVWLFDAAGRLVLAVPEAAPQSLEPEIAAVIANHKVAIVDLHGPPAGALEMNFVAPIFRPEAEPPSVPIGTIVLTIDPTAHLYPLIQARSAGSATAETLLVRREGDEVVYLNGGSRHSGGAAMQRRSLHDRRLAAALAANRSFSVQQTHDDRGRAVLAAARAVRDSPWVLVAKVDLSEVYAPIVREAWQMTALIGALFLAAGFFAAFVWRHRHVADLVRALKAEAERNALAARLSLVMQHANDIIILTDSRDRIVEANRRALETYGYSLEKLQQLPPGGLRTRESQESYPIQRGLLNSPAGTIFETVHRRKDGTTFPVEVSGRSFEADGQRYRLGIYRDITQRKAQEAQIERLTRVHAALSHVNQAIVRTQSRENLFADICRILVQFGGFKMAWIGCEQPDMRAVIPVAQFGDEGYLARIEVYADDRAEGRGPTGTAFREGRRYVCNDFYADAQTLPWRDAAVRAGFAASLALPVRAGERVVAVLTVYAGVKDFFGEKEIELLEEAAGDVSFALGNLEREARREQAEAGLLKAHQDFAKAFIASPTAVSVNTQAGGHYLDVNEAWEQLSGYRRSEVLGRTTMELGVWADPGELENVRRLVATEGRIRGREFRFLRKSGEEATCLLSIEVISFAGEPCLLSTVVDITERQRAAAAVRASEARFRALFDNSLDGFILGAPEGRILAANPAACGLFGLTEAEIIRGGRGAITTTDDPRLPVLLEERARTGRAQGELTMIRGDGTRFETEITSVVFPTDEGPRSSLVIRDITGRKRAEAALKWEQNLFERLVGSLPDRIYFKDRDSRFIRINAAMMHSLGLAHLGDAVGKNDFDFFADEHARQAFNDEQAIIRTGTPLVDIEEKETWLDGRVTWVSTTKMPLLDAVSDQIVGILGVSRDITAHKESERRIREQAELINKANEAIIVADLDHRITFWSRGAERIFGWTSTEAVGRKVVEMILQSGTSISPQNEDGFGLIGDWRGEIHSHDRSGRPLVIETSVTVLRDELGQPTGRLSISSDITEKTKLAEQFLRAQRLESIGMLAAGIAHDLNNVLAPIGMAAPLLRTNTTDARDLRLLETLEKCAERGAGLVRQILGFAHGVGGEPRLVQVKHLLRDIVNVITETFPKAITLEDVVPNELWPVLANPTQIHQMLLNLCVNARDAMPHGGVLRLRAENLTLDPPAAAQIEGARPGAWVVLHVEDTGAGIPLAVLPRIWEPFFTTKTADKGTGLGLSTVRGLVEAHHGFITLKTEAGQGTTFRVYLPAAGAEIPGAGPPALEPAAHGHDELILLVDDEELIRHTAASILRCYGYRILTASDGGEALVLFEKNAAEIALVITDRDMPVLDGDGLASAIHRLAPRTKILCMSGLANGPRGDAARPAEAVVAFIGKPFRVEELLGAVRRLLHDPTPLAPTA